MANETKTRIDKYLWSIRIFKSRSLASENCTSGKIKINDSNSKPSSTVKVGDFVYIKKNHINHKILVLKIIEKRVSADIAVTCFQDLTSIEEKNKFNSWYDGSLRPEFRDPGAGRPTKKERRQIDNYKILDAEE